MRHGHPKTRGTEPGHPIAGASESGVQRRGLIVMETWIWLRMVEAMETRVVVEDLVFAVVGMSTVKVDGLEAVEKGQWRLCRGP